MLSLLLWPSAALTGLSAAAAAIQPAPAAQSPAVPAPAAASDVELTMLRLVEGGILWGQLAGHDAQGVTFVRLDNGGRVHVPWARLDPVQSSDFQERFGYVDHSGDELMIDADRLQVQGGLEWVGRIVNRTDDEIWIKTASALAKVPKLRLSGPATVVHVPALDVYTGEELYQSELAKLDPSSAQSQFDLALFCDRVLEFEHALEHFQRARDLDPTFKADEISARVERTRVKAASKAQIEYLREVDRLRGRGQFDVALSKLQAFGELFPKSDLAADALRKSQQVEKARQAALRERTLRAWHKWAGQLVLQKAREKDSTLQGAVSWLEESMREGVLDAVHKELTATVSAAVTPEQVLSYWKGRDDNARVHKASYGGGTWLLGPEAARAGMPEVAADPSKLSGVEAERARLEARVRAFMLNSAAVRKAKLAEGEEDEQQKFWASWSAADRAQWLLAHYAEKAGDMRLVRIDARPCTDCGGSGVREIVHATAVSPTGNNAGANRPMGGDTEKVACPLCHNVGVVRRVVYR